MDKLLESMIKKIPEDGQKYLIDCQSGTDNFDPEKVNKIIDNIIKDSDCSEIELEFMVDWVDRHAKYAKNLNNEVLSYCLYSESLEDPFKFPSCNTTLDNLEKVKKYIQEELQ